MKLTKYVLFVSFAAHCIPAIAMEFVFKELKTLTSKSQRLNYRKDLLTAIKMVDEDKSTTYGKSAKLKQRKQLLDAIVALDNLMAPTTPPTGGEKSGTTPPVTWVELDPYQGDIGKAIAALEPVVKSIEDVTKTLRGSVDAKRSKQKDLMEVVTGKEKIFNDMDILNANIADVTQTFMNSLPKVMTPEAIDKALMAGFCLQAMKEIFTKKGMAEKLGDAAKIDVITELNKAFSTADPKITIPNNANADALLTLAVLAPLS